jgi:plasmid stabilization system protein ParE
MRGKRAVLWTRVAERDLVGVIGHIAESSARNAGSVLRRIETAAARLALHGERGRLVPELYELGVSRYRELIVSPWRIIYRIAEGEVFVLAVVDSRRNLEDLLLERFLDGGTRSAGAGGKREGGQ